MKATVCHHIHVKIKSMHVWEWARLPVSLEKIQVGGEYKPDWIIKFLENIEDYCESKRRYQALVKFLDFVPD